MNKLLTILLLFITHASAAQSDYTNLNSVPEGVSAYWWNEGRRYPVFKPVGWSASDSLSVIVFSFGGAGETTAASMWGVPPINHLNNSTWNGTLNRNQGDVVKFLYVGVRDTALQNAVYTLARNLIQQAVIQTGIDTTSSPEFKVIIAGLSAGANMVNRLKVAGGSNHAWTNWVKRWMIAATPAPYATGDPAYERYNNNLVRVYTTTEDTHPSTPRTFSIRLVDSISNASNANVSLKSYDDVCHCAWTYAYSITGLTDPAGTHEPDSNEWRIMVNDLPYEEPVEPQPVEETEVIRVRMRIRVIE